MVGQKGSSNSRYSKDQTLRRLSRTYGIAVFTIVSFAIIGECIVSSVLRNNALDNERQSLAISQKDNAISLSRDLFSVAALPDGEMDRFSHASVSLNRLEVARRSLADMERAEGSRENGMTNTMLLLMASDAVYGRVTGAVRRVLGGGPANIRTESSQEALRLIDKYQPTFESSLDDLTTQVQTENAERAQVIQSAQSVFAWLTLILILAEGYFVFLPAFRQTRLKISHLETDGEELMVQQGIVREQNARLQQDNQHIQEAASGLESANLRYEAAARRFEELFQGLPIACFGYDSNGSIFEWNRACEQLFGLAPAEMFGRTVVDLLAPEEPNYKLEKLLDSVAKGEPTELLEVVHRMSNGEYANLLCNTFPIHGQDDQISGGILSCVDITGQKAYERQIEQQLLRINEYSTEIEQRRWELEEANARLESLASTDGLTGLNNHRTFQEALHKEIKRARREGADLSLVLLDVDHFKPYNDSFGHPAGDAVLQRVAGILIECARETDVVARYGGEEFVVILPSTGALGAMHVAERMRKAVENGGWERREITVSMGVSTLSDALDTGAAIIQAADEALYASKHNGRNRVTYSDKLAKEAA